MNPKLHILFLCSWYPSKVFKSNGDFIRRHAEAVSTKHKVSVLHIVSNPEVNATTIEIVEKSNLTEYIGYIKPSSVFFVKWLRFWKAYKAIIKKIDKIDVVHVHRIFPMGIFALQLKRKKGLKYIISEHWTGFHFSRERPLSWFESYFSKRIAKKASVICPVSEDLMKSMLKTGIRGSYSVIPNVVDTDLFQPRIKISSEFVITHISDLNDDHKNISGMLKAASELSKKLNNFTWNFIGGKKDSYSQLLKELDFGSARIQFIDHVEHKKIAEFLNDSDVFVLFSNYENLPCVILESFASGTPVISTDVGGISEFFPADFGFLIPPKDQQKLVEKIMQIQKNPILKKSIMHHYAEENFSPKKICDSFTKLYLDAIN